MDLVMNGLRPRCRSCGDFATKRTKRPARWTACHTCPGRKTTRNRRDTATKHRSPTQTRRDTATEPRTRDTARITIAPTKTRRDTATEPRTRDTARIATCPNAPTKARRDTATKPHTRDTTRITIAPTKTRRDTATEPRSRDTARISGCRRDTDLDNFRTNWSEVLRRDLHRPFFVFHDNLWDLLRSLLENRFGHLSNSFCDDNFGNWDDYLLLQNHRDLDHPLMHLHLEARDLLLLELRLWPEHLRDRFRILDLRHLHWSLLLEHRWHFLNPLLRAQAEFRNRLGHRLNLGPGDLRDRLHDLSLWDLDDLLLTQHRRNRHNFLGIVHDMLGDSLVDIFDHRLRDFPYNLSYFDLGNLNNTLFDAHLRYFHKLFDELHPVNLNLFVFVLDLHPRHLLDDLARLEFRHFTRLLDNFLEGNILDSFA